MVVVELIVQSSHSFCENGRLCIENDVSYEGQKTCSGPNF